MSRRFRRVAGIGLSLVLSCVGLNLPTRSETGEVPASGRISSGLPAPGIGVKLTDEPVLLAQAPKKTKGRPKRGMVPKTDEVASKKGDGAAAGGSGLKFSKDIAPIL